VHSHDGVRDGRPRGAHGVHVDVNETPSDAVREHLRDVVLGLQTIEEVAERG
jgi:hypothetical protein